MTDLAHYFGGDLLLSPTGGLLTVDGAEKTKQRLLRRLMTNPGGYIWHLQYGAGVGAMVGQPADARRIKAIVLTQVLQEEAVASDPVPTVTVRSDNNGVVVADIVYMDADTGTTQTLALAVS